MVGKGRKCSTVAVASQAAYNGLFYSFSFLERETATHTSTALEHEPTRPKPNPSLPSNVGGEREGRGGAAKPRSNGTKRAREARRRRRLPRRGREEPANGTLIAAAAPEAARAVILA
jgi:hypothetical protein